MVLRKIAENSATAFFRAGLIESWGRGIEKINNECRVAGIPIPEINYDFSGLMITFRVKKMSGKTSEKILRYIRENSSVTITELSSLIQVSERSIERNLQKLQVESKLERVGPANGGYWKVPI